MIPVLDLKGGTVVRAQGGDRANYRPITTPLAEGSAPEAVLAGLLRIAPFGAVYIADLDAIENGAPQREVVAALMGRFPALDVWLDAGYRVASDVPADPPRLRPVFGTETLGGAAALREAVSALGAEGCVLSLDFRGERFLGDEAILAAPGGWPADAIAMTLHSVGGGGGPDLARLAALRRGYAGRLHAAGGVRDAADLRRLAEMGVAGALVASALHDGRLGAAELAAFA